MWTVRATLLLGVLWCAETRVIVNEVIVRKRGSGEGLDQVEFYNDGEASVNLEGYFFTDDVRGLLPNEVRNFHTFTFTAENVIDSKSYLLVDVAPFGLAQEDEINFYDYYAELIDHVKWGKASSTEADGLSWSLCKPNSTDPMAWQTQPATPLADNTPMCSSVQSIRPSGHVIISEVFVGQESLGQADWVELYNPSTNGSVADLTGWHVTDKVKAYYYSKKIPPGTTVAAGAYYVVDFNRIGDRKLGDSDEVHLFNGLLEEVDETRWTENTYRSAKTSIALCPLAVSAAAVADVGPGRMDWSLTSIITKGAANSCPALGGTGLVISEVAASTDTGIDWIEFQNVGTTDLDIIDWRFGDESARFSADGKRIKADTNITEQIVAPGGFVVIDFIGLDEFGFGVKSDNVTLFNDLGQLVQTTSWNISTGPLLGTTWARCGVIDGGSAVEYYATSVPTQGAANVCDRVIRRSAEESSAASAVAGSSVLVVSLASLFLMGLS
jgi:hypothetical protein